MSNFIRLLPNILTGSRIFFAAIFLLLLIMTDQKALLDADRIAGEVWKLHWSFIMFVIAGVTDILDGPLARRLKVTSQFGRTFDPFVDKILIGGGFIMLAIYDYELTGIAWWMVGVILAREIFVTVIRSMSESRGKEFAATWAGKVKMFIQSFTIGTIIIYMSNFQNVTWAYYLRQSTIWVTVLFTVFSALIYTKRVQKLRIFSKN
jgi:CDP-diacylglycerol--glycerol-3-phosphate 3-phosphatidyltransferase